MMQVGEEKAMARNASIGKKLGIILLALKNSRPISEVKSNLLKYLGPEKEVDQNSGHFLIVSKSILNQGRVSVRLQFLSEIQNWSSSSLKKTSTFKIHLPRFHQSVASQTSSPTIDRSHISYRQLRRETYSASSYYSKQDATSMKQG